MMPIQTGAAAPDFKLYDDRKEAFRLSDYKGRQNVLLLFFPGAFTSVCSAELNHVNEERHAFGRETEIVGISTDSPFVLAEFRKVHDLEFALLSDHDAAVSAAYGAKYDRDFTPMQLDRIAKRAAFVIDTDGIVRYAEVLESAGDLPDFDEIKRVLADVNG